MFLRTLIVSTCLTFAMPVFAEAPRTPAPADARAYIISPADGATVSSPVLVRFGLHGMGVAPAGVEREKTGHHHLLIDRGLPDMNAPMDKEIMHFGGGQTETSIELEPGQHTLQLLLGDHAHRPHANPVISEKITITVK